MSKEHVSFRTGSMRAHPSREFSCPATGRLRSNVHKECTKTPCVSCYMILTHFLFCAVPPAPVATRRSFESLIIARADNCRGKPKRHEVVRLSQY